MPEKCPLQLKYSLAMDVQCLAGRAGSTSVKYERTLGTRIKRVRPKAFCRYGPEETRGKMTTAAELQRTSNLSMGRDGKEMEKWGGGRWRDG